MGKTKFIVKEVAFKFNPRIDERGLHYYRVYDVRLVESYYKQKELSLDVDIENLSAGDKLNHGSETYVVEKIESSFKVTRDPCKLTQENIVYLIKENDNLLNKEVISSYGELVEFENTLKNEFEEQRGIRVEKEREIRDLKGELSKYQNKKLKKILFFWKKQK